MTYTRAKQLMQAAHSIWPPEVRVLQSRDYRRTIEHGWFRMFSKPDKEFDELLEKALQNQGPPKDIDAWAHKLASDVAHLTD